MIPFRLLVDLQATQSPSHADRGVARYVREQVRALGQLGVGDAYLLNPHLPFPRALDHDLLTSSRLRWSTQSELRRIAEADDRPVAFYLTSPFEISPWGDGDLPTHLLRGDVPVVATLYDLIPLLMPERYLTEPAPARRYRARLDQLHHLDLVLTISEHTRRDAIRLLDLDPGRVRTIGFGVSPFFHPPDPQNDPDAVLARFTPEVRRPYVASVLGDDPRKNAERLFEAWAAARAELRTDHQLVVMNSLSAAGRQRWERAVTDVGLVPGDDVVLTGWHADDVLRSLYQRCDLFVFPSLYEGAGLPPAEAIACGAPVLTSCTSSLPEVLDFADATFDPASTGEMASSIVRGLADEEFRTQLRRRGAERAPFLTWDAVARRTLDALATLPAPSGPTRLPTRIALVGPMPPTPSGIADYNARLLPALARRGEVDVFTPARPPGGERHPGVRWFPPTALHDACSPWGYDAVVYTAGNSDDHHDLYELALQFPGILWLHDARIPGLYVTYGRERVGGPEGARRFLAERLERQYHRRLPAHVRAQPDREPSELNDVGLGMTKELLDRARGLIVSSRLAARLVALDQPPDSPTPTTWVLPLGVPEPWSSGAPRARASIVSLGMVSPLKGCDLLISALARLRAGGTDATLTFVGGVADDYRAHLEQLASAAGVGDALAFTGHVDDEGYRRWLATATLTVQLRRSTNGESSAAVTDALAAGLPVVTNVHAAAELPEGTVSLVPGDVDSVALADHLGDLLADPGRRQALADAGRAYARSWGFDDVADELLRIIRACQR